MVARINVIANALQPASNMASTSAFRLPARRAVQGQTKSLGCGSGSPSAAVTRAPARQFNTSLPRSASGPSSSSSSSSSSSTSSSKQAYNDIYSSAYRGQGARSDYPPWYRSPTLLLLGFMPIFTFGLGVWQVKRLEWKLGLIEELEWKLRKEPIELPRNVNLSVLPSFEFRLVSVAGHFDHSRVMFLGPRVREGVVGYNVVVPLKRDGGGDEVLIDRGFVSEKSLIIEGETKRLRESEAIMPSSHVSLTALLPRISGANYFTPPNEPHRNRWYHADPKEMAEWASTSSAPATTDPYPDSHTPSAGVGESVKKMLGVGNSEHKVLPIFLEEIYEGYDGNIRVDQGIPVGRGATIELRNQHLVYAGTWFSLSAATTAMFALLLRRRRLR